jgi:hypothetical protein
MRISNAVLIAAISCLPCLACVAQTPTPRTPATAASTEPTPVPSTKPTSVPPGTPAPTASSPSVSVAAAVPLTTSGLLQPSLDAVWQTATSLKLERWKRGTVRDEAGDDVHEILKDIHTNLPPLLSASDSAPETISKAYPVARNIDALYDVVLRVYEAARVSAPPEQIAQLQQALVSLKNARIALDDRLQESASAIEKQVSDLQTTVKAQAAVKCPATPAPVIPACVAPTPAKKVVRKKPNPPATNSPASPAPATAAPKPQN